MQEIYDICTKLGIEPNLQLKKAIRGKAGITAYSLIHTLVLNDNLIEAAASIGYSDNPVKQCIRELLQPKFSNRAKEYGLGGATPSWRLTLLALINKKFCNDCSVIKDFSEFPPRTDGKDSTTGLAPYCKSCKLIQSNEAKHHILLRTPSWANHDKIKEFYLKCPEGSHVDHIIPLRGKLASGLHVEYNLQYLTKEDNQKKSNKFEPL